MPKLLRYFLFALLLIVVALVSALTTMRLAIHVGEVRVPDFRGKTPAEARRLADASGLVSQVETNYYSPAVPEGRVLSQGPAPGTIVRRGWEVQLALSLGPQRVTIPQVVGQSERAAGISIAERGLQLSSTDEVTIPGIDAGQVIAQNPPANSTDVSAPKIALLLARDPAPQAFVMPSFIGQPLGAASNTLKDAGFSIGKVTVAVVESTPASTPQAPATNSQAAAGSVTINSSPTPQTPGAATSNAPPQVPSAASIIVSQDPPPGHKIFAGAAVNFTVR
ncbi:MAG TPA: PASTA domain-containing protein [Terriglobales bacterium]|nr:PASTA domain-containing protein [Terriglobales bacterium]